MRAFLALPIPGDVREHAIRVSRLLREHGVRGKWVRPEHMHFTLVFLGEAAEPALAELGARLAPELAVVAPVSLTYARVAGFGMPPRVLFTEWQDVVEGAFAGVVGRIRTQAEKAGISLDQSGPARRPVAHLTLVRFRGRRESVVLRELVEIQRTCWAWRIRLPEPSLTRVRFASVRLYRSVLGRAGPTYDVMQEFVLGGDCPGPGPAVESSWPGSRS